MVNLHRKGTFEIALKANLLINTTPISLMWVFTYKFDSNEYLLKYKAHLVAQGDLQTITKEIYAAILAAQTFQFIIAIAYALTLVYANIMLLTLLQMPLSLNN